MEQEKLPQMVQQEFNTANAGLNMDRLPSQLEKGRLSYALNAAVENFDASGVSYQNELGNELCLSFPEGFVLIGHHFINERSKHIFFLTNPSTGDCQIGYMINNDCTYRTLVDDPCLGWDIQHPIHKIVHKITNCSEEIYWPDNVARRWLDLNDIPYLLQEGATLCDPIYTNRIDCNQLRIQPDFEIPLISVVDVINGGDLLSGVYQFAIQYADAVGNPYTSYYSITNPTPIADVNTVTSNFNYHVGKSIVVNIENLDVSGQFQYFNLAIIKTINAISSVELVGTYFIERDNTQITYTGQSKTDVRLSMDDIFEKFPYYDIADDITTAQDILIWKGLTSVERINYQEIASKINLQWETWRIPATENYADEINATNIRGYIRDEVYAFEIAFLLANGKQTDGFHIPGREYNNDDLYPAVARSSPDYTEGDLLASPRFKIYNTATLIGYSPEKTDASDYKGPWQYGRFAYWESEEEYPCNIDVWSDLAGQKIRHHKFPDLSVSPIFESGDFDPNDPDRLSTMTMESRAIYPLGVKIDPNEVRMLIQQSSLTDEQKRDIVGFKILRGNRSGNSSIVAKGILRNVNKYSRDGNDYYFANYPYNDLKEDVFLNNNNNAYLGTSQCFNLNILAADPVSGIVIEYVDVFTNRIAYISYPEGINWVLQFCSLTEPRALDGTGLMNTYPCSYSGFTITLFRSPGATIVTASYSFIDPYLNYTTDSLTVASALPVFESRQRVTESVVVITNIVVDGTPLSPADRAAYQAQYITINTYEGPIPYSCAVSEEEPLQALTTLDDVKSLHIFNSPETSFGQPILGNVLKLEGRIFGKGVAHFTEVLKNARYKLITKEAQEDLIEKANDIAAGLSVGLDAYDMAGFFSAYDSYMTITLNSVSGRNFATSFNSIASYDYYTKCETLGQIQRVIESKKYLIPRVVSVDDIVINNWNRETSVFIKTENDPLDFPTQSGITDNSRFTMSTRELWTEPFADQDIQVLSYYASLKNIFRNQWGQIYTYETIDTGYQCIFDINDNDRNIFGGDTFICRFNFKTKLPFFTDNRVNAPDNSDIFYDEIGNVAYPKYWHTSRSIQENVTIGCKYPNPAFDCVELSNFISYKDHNFDLPNSQSTNIPGDINRLIYAGYFYLFAYGIPSFYCETSYNLDLRQAFNDKEGDFWPHVSSSIPDDWLQEFNVTIAQDNTYYYNTSYSKQNKENVFTHIPPDWEDKLCLKSYPFRAIYSDLQNTDADNRVNSWRAYRAVSYFDFPQNYGNFTSLDGIQDSAILARFENKTLMYNKLLTIDTNNPKAAYIGNPVLFRGSPPIDFAETDLGYAGSQHKMLLKIPQGQISIDAKRGQVFLLTGSQVNDLSEYGSGVNRFFTEHLPFEILKYYPEVNVDNHYNGVGLHGVYDSNYDRIIITKLDYIPLRDDILYENGEFYIENTFSTVVYDCHFEAIIDEIYSTTTTTTSSSTTTTTSSSTSSTTTTTSTTTAPGTVVTTTTRTIVSLNDPEYFCNRSWTISFNLNTKTWISFHSYIPNYYIAENNFFYSGVNDCCLDFDFIAATLIPSTTTTTTTIIPTTTTSTTSTTSTTTTSTSTTTTTTTTEYVCQRPENLNIFLLYMGYVTISPPVTFDSTLSAEDACVAMHLTFDDANFFPITQVAEATNLSIGSTVYEGTGVTNCDCMPDGWYFTYETYLNNNVFRIENCTVAEYHTCVITTTSTTTSTTSSTTTTTTTSAPVPISCSEDITYDGEEIYPANYTVNASSGTGTVFFAYAVYTGAPARFIVSWNSGVVIDTGYVGSNDYNFGETNRGAFTAMLTGLVDPITSNTYPDIITYPDDGYPLIDSVISGTDMFDKSAVSPSDVIVDVYSPMPFANWQWKVYCPTTTTTSTTSTSTTSTTTTSTSTSSTTTTTTTVIVLESDVLLNTGTNPTAVYSYNPDTTVSTALSVPSVTGNSADIAHTANKMWLYQSATFAEWNITLSPFSATYNTAVGSGAMGSAGLCAKDDNTLICFSSYGIYELTFVPFASTFKFNVIYGRNVSGDYFLTTNNKFIITTSQNGVGRFITQYDYLTGQMEVDIPLTMSAPYGIFQYDGEIFIVNCLAGSAEIYKIDTTTPYNLTLVDTVPFSVFGASQIPSYLTASFTATKAPVVGDVYTFSVSNTDFASSALACADVSSHVDAVFSAHPIEEMVDEQLYTDANLSVVYTGSGIRWFTYEEDKYWVELNNGVILNGGWC